MTTHGGARAALERALDTIEGDGGRLNAFVTVASEAARETADAADAATAEGRWLGLLHGMPMAVKDCIETAGLRTTSGSTFFENHVPNDDAAVVARLRRAGAVIVGKATLHELCFGIRSVNPVSGQCRNPWNTDRVPGGSSGGSGAALAAGMVEGALGSDTGGSVRLPASFCGVSGLRPTVGRVPNHGATPLSPTYDTIGPMARRVEDVARIFAAIAGPDRRDPMSSDRPLENFLPSLGDGISGIRVGVPGNYYFDGVPDDIAEVVMAALREFGVSRRGIGGGRRTRRRRDPEPRQHDRVLRCLRIPRRAPGRKSGWFQQGRLRSHDHRTVVQRRRLFPRGPRPRGLAADPARSAPARLGGGSRAVRAREAWRRTLAGLFEDIDILASPTAPADPPPVVDDRSLLEATGSAARNTYAGAHGAIPGLSVPCGFSAAGLPVGLQLEAARWREPLLLRAGVTYQSETEWHLARPGESGAG